jgi:hypothetical protein
MLPHVQGFKGFDRKILLKFMNFFPLRMYKRQALNEVRYSYELSSAVDYDLALRLDEKFPGRLGRLDMGKITYHYRQHGEQVSRLARTQQDINAREALQASLNRRQSGLIVTNSRPPFACVPREIAVEEHFIWNSK